MPSYVAYRQSAREDNICIQITDLQDEFQVPQEGKIQKLLWRDAEQSLGQEGVI